MIFNCIAFIYRNEKINGEMRPFPCGTGFFVGIRSEVDGEGIYIYLVTAKHIIENVRKEDLSIRVDTQKGPIHFMHPGGFNWFSHPDDEDVDVAVTPFTLNNVEFGDKYPSFLSPGIFLNSKNIEDGDIEVGNDVFISGLFSQHDGKFNNLPIIRLGNIAMFPDENEKVSVKWHNAKIDAYLIEARSVGGLSGSPVFFREPYFKVTATGHMSIRPRPKFYLGGLIHGHFVVGVPESDNKDFFSEERYVNEGVAIVVPATKISETLMQDKLKLIRSEKDCEFNREKSASESS